MVDGPTYEQRWDAGTVAAIALAVGWFPVRANDGARVEAMVGAALEAAGVPGLLAELETARTQRDDAQAQAERMTRIVLGEDLEGSASRDEWNDACAAADSVLAAAASEETPHA